MDKYVVTVETNEGELICRIGDDLYTLVNKKEAQVWINDMQKHYINHNYRIYKLEEVNNA